MEKGEKERRLSVVYLQSGRKEITLPNEKAVLTLIVFVIRCLWPDTRTRQSVEIITNRQTRHQ
jgi:hypothetical protein